MFLGLVKDAGEGLIAGCLKSGEGCILRRINSQINSQRQCALDVSFNIRFLGPQ